MILLVGDEKKFLNKLHIWRKKILTVVAYSLQLIVWCFYIQKELNFFDRWVDFYGRWRVWTVSLTHKYRYLYVYSCACMCNIFTYWRRVDVCIYILKFLKYMSRVHWECVQPFWIWQKPFVNQSQGELPGQAWTNAPLSGSSVSYETP